MGRIFKTYINSPRVFSCAKCKIHLCAHEDIVSKAFQGRTGRAFLFSQVSNVSQGPPEERILNTGMHKVCDLYCVDCHSYIGWKYEMAYEESQKYKEGKCVVERANMIKDTSWV